MSDIGDRLKEERNRIGYTQDELSSVVGAGKRTIIDWEKNATRPNADHLARCAELNMDVCYIITGKYAVSSIQGDYIYVPVYQVEVSAGTGVDALECQPERYHAFRRRWADFHGLKEKDLLVVKIKGDSMVPALQDGEHVVVNTASKEPKTGRIFVVRSGTELLAKYIEMQINGDIILRSRNDFYSDIVLTPADLACSGVEIIGEVIHSSRDL